LKERNGTAASLSLHGPPIVPKPTGGGDVEWLKDDTLRGMAEVASDGGLGASRPSPCLPSDLDAEVRSRMADRSLGMAYVCVFALVMYFCFGLRNDSFK